jgi:hypothetical protein
LRLAEGPLRGEVRRQAARPGPLPTAPGSPRNDPDKPREQLLDELHAPRDRVTRLEAAPGGPPQPEDALRQLPAWASQTLGTFDDTFIVLDGEWRFRYANRPALGHAREPLGDPLGQCI